MNERILYLAATMSGALEELRAIFRNQNQTTENLLLFSGFEMAFQHFQEKTLEIKTVKKASNAE